MSSISKNLDQPNGGPHDERETSLLMGALQGLAVARKKEALLKKASTKKHNRTVSWDPDAVPPSIVKDYDESFDAMSQVTQPAPDELESPPSSPKKSRWGKIVLKDVLTTNPLESEAESYIQRSLEEADPTQAGQSESQKSILSGVPDDIKHDFSGESEARSVGRSERSTKSLRTVEEEASHESENTAYALRVSVTTAEKLFGLAGEMKKMHSQDVRGAGSSFEATSQSDAFAYNAATIVNRLKKNSGVTGETAPTPKVETATAGGGKSKWGKVRQSVVVAGAIRAGTNKKSDEEVVDSDVDADPDFDADADVDVDIEAGNDDNWNEETAGGKGSNSAFQKMKRAKEQIKSDLNDFEDFLKFRQGSMISYIKFVLFCVIIPATGISALLFYAVDNPPCGVAKECLAEEIARNMTLASLNITQEQKDDQFSAVFDRENVSQASISWWLLFVFVRQVRTRIIVVAAGKGISAPFLTLLRLPSTGHHTHFCPDVTSCHYRLLLSAIDIIDQNTWSFPDALHRYVLFVKPLLTDLNMLCMLTDPLCVVCRPPVQSKGWPFTLFCWGVNNLCFLYGKSSFARHWLFFQDAIDMVSRFYNNAVTVCCFLPHSLTLYRLSFIV
jgi:hypothetical protein